MDTGCHGNHRHPGNGSHGVDWTRWIFSIATAAVLVILASTLTNRRGATVRR
jgi:hypothetical protein